MKHLKSLLTIIFMTFPVFVFAQKSVDFTKLGSQMKYAQVYNMIMDPTEWEGASIKIAGTYYENMDPNNGPEYHCVMVSDVTQCCMAGFDLLKKDETIKYPKHLSEIEVTGTFISREEDGITRTYLVIDTLQTK